MHPLSPAPMRFGGYDKLSKVYELTLATMRSTVDLTVEIVGRIHQFLGGDGVCPQWLPPRSADGMFDIETSL